jgi:hypothetical protein
MNGLKRVAAALVLVAATAAAAQAQNYGMPLFANPHYSTGMRLFADVGQPADQIEGNLTDQTTVQGGLGFTLGRFGIQALVAGNWTDIEGCTDGGDVECSQVYVSAAALAGLRVYGGGDKPLALAVFGGAGTDVTSVEVTAGVEVPKQVIIPVGASIGYKLGPVILWAAPRMNFVKWANCPTGFEDLCEGTESDFRWSAGINLPLGPLGIRAAYDSGKWAGSTETVSNFGVGVSLGIGSQN